MPANPGRAVAGAAVGTARDNARSTVSPGKVSARDRSLARTTDGAGVGVELSDWLALGGVLVGLAGVAVAIWAVQGQRRPKQLDYFVVSSAGLLRPEAQRMREPLSIDYDGVPMRTPWLATIRVVNTGKQAVEAADYVDPIRVTYERNPPFDGYVAATSRDGLWPEGQSIWPADPAAPTDSSEPLGTHEIHPPLLNPGEWLEVQLLSDGDPGGLTVQAAFPDQSRPMQSAQIRGPQLRRQRLQRVFLSMLFGGAVGILVSTVLRGGPLGAFEVLVLITVIGGALVLLAFATLADEKNWRTGSPIYE